MVKRRKQIENGYYLELSIDEVKKTFIQELKQGKITSDDCYDSNISLLLELGFINIDDKNEVKQVEKPCARSNDLKNIIMEVVSKFRDREYITICMLQKELSIGFNRATNIINKLEELGLVERRDRYCYFTPEIDKIDNELKNAENA